MKYKNLYEIVTPCFQNSYLYREICKKIIKCYQYYAKDSVGRYENKSVKIKKEKEYLNKILNKKQNIKTKNNLKWFETV